MITMTCSLCMTISSCREWERQQIVIAMLCDNFTYRCKYKMLREYRAGASNSTWGRRTELLKELIPEMRQELAIFFLFEWKSKRGVLDVENHTCKCIEKGKSMPSVLSDLFSTTTEELLPVARKYKFQQLQNCIVPDQQTHWKEGLAYSPFIIFQKWKIIDLAWLLCPLPKPFGLIEECSTRIGQS